MRMIQDRIWRGAASFSDHALDEMKDEAILPEDVRQAVLAGVLEGRQTCDVRGTRYVFLGRGMDRNWIKVVCRLIEESVRIITVYRIYYVPRWHRTRDLK